MSLIVNLEQISHIVHSVFIVDFEQVKAGWVKHLIYNNEKVFKANNPERKCCSNSTIKTVERCP